MEGKYTEENGKEERRRKGRKEEARERRRKTIGKQTKGTEKERERKREEVTYPFLAWSIECTRMRRVKRE